MAYVDFSDFSDSPQDEPIPAASYGTEPQPRATADLTYPGGTTTPIGTGPITTQPQPRATTNTPTIPGATHPGYIGPAATSPFYVLGSNPVYDRVARFFTAVSGGKYTPTQYDVSQWGSNLDENYLGHINQAIINWWKGYSANQPAAAPSATTPGTPSMSAADFIKQYQSGHNVSEGVHPILDALKAAGYNVAPYMYGSTESHNEITLDGNKYKVIGAEDSPNAYWYTAGQSDGGGGGSTGGPGGVNGNALGYDDPSAQIYLSQLASRLNQLNTPQHDPWEDILKLFALKRVEGLDGAPYTGAEDAAMIAHYRDPLTQARDASLQRNKERIGSRGMAPTSGLLDVLNRDTEQTYERGIASGANDLGVRAVAEKQRRSDEQLQVLNSILGVNRTGVDRKNDLADRAVAISKMFPDFDAQRLDMLLRASGENPSATGTLANLNQLGNLGLGSTINQQNRDAENQALYGQIFAAFIDYFTRPKK